ncbi:MAG: hypothetical protein M3R25_07110 [Bacteroidota bacterium]|nr:hypothetical protein [Bacteroidota bacterium]
MNKRYVLLAIGAILLALAVIFMFPACTPAQKSNSPDATKTVEDPVVATPQTTIAPTSDPSEPFVERRYTLHTLMSQPLVPQAELIVNKDKWVLNFNNGEELIYTITTMSKGNSICGHNAIDSKGKECMLCITPTTKGAIVQFKYDTGVLTYRGTPI